MIEDMNSVRPLETLTCPWLSASTVVTVLGVMRRDDTNDILIPLMIGFQEAKNTGLYPRAIVSQIFSRNKGVYTIY